MEENKALFTKVGSTNADIMHYDELRFDVTIPANTTSGEIRPDTLAVTVLNNDSLTPVKQNGKLQIQNNSDSPQTGIVSVRGRITDIILDGIANWVTDVYGHKNSIKIRAPYLTKFSLPRNPKTVKLNLADLLVLKKLEVLQIGNTSVTGDISSLASLTKLTYLNITNTSVTGDVQVCIDNMPLLKTLKIPKTVTITDEQKKTLTDRGCTITIL